MTNWQQVVDSGYAVPADRPIADLVAELAVAVRSPDPVLRDRLALSILGRWIAAGALPAEERSRLGEEMARRFTDPEIQARTFAPLVLDCLVSAGDFAPSWVDAFGQWYPAEKDLRGYDVELGWLHAVAHGADLLGTFGRCPQVAPESMLNLAVERLLARTDYVLRDQEDDRLAHAMALTLTRPELTETTAVAWLDPVAADFAAGVPGPVPAHASNTMRTLRMLYLLVDRGVRPGWRGEPAIAVSHRDAVRARLAEVLALTAPFAG